MVIPLFQAVLPLAENSLLVKFSSAFKMGKLSRYARERVVALHSQKVSVTRIRDILEEEGIKTSRGPVSLFLSRYRRTGRIVDAPRSGRRPVLNSEHLKFFDDQMIENDELTSKELKTKLEQCGVIVSQSSI